MKNFIIILVKLSILILSYHNELYAQSKLEVKFQPRDSLYVYENRGFGTTEELYSAVIQNIAVLNHANEDVVVDEVNIIVTKDGKELQKIKVEDSVLIRSAKKFKTYQKQGILELYDFQFQTSKYLNGIDFSESTTISKNQAIVITHRTILSQFLPDLVLVHAKGHTTKGKIIVGKGTLNVVNHKSKNKYYFPLKGTWIALGAPSLISHHRWGTIQEFAFDFVKIGEDNITHKDSGSRLTNYYAYGEPVYSIGDGIVVSTYSKAIESDQNLKQPNEKDEDYIKRQAIEQQKLLAKGFSFAMGNHIIIKHDNNEYSHYLHLKSGSLKVKPGDVIIRGQHIADLGHSGNSTEPHLHFHVTDGPDMAYSRSIPVTFHNISFYPDNDINIRHIHYGQIIMAND